MAEVPREAVSFARMVVRAFYPPEFVVAVDGVLRANNYVSHNDLSNRLKLIPKELRITMVKLVTAGLVKSEKRAQKRVNIMDDRRTSRTVNTEFWYVPLREVVDSFMYRVHRITNELDAAIAKAGADRLYVCRVCKFEYSELEVVSRMNDAGEFVCDQFGRTMSRRPTYCGGLITEQDTSEEKKETEALRRRFATQLKPLRERAEKCATLKIPAHPLEGADEETWGALVPETVGAMGERVTEEGITPEMAANSLSAAQDSDKRAAAQLVPQDDNEPIPEKPSWFKDGGAGDEDNDDEWDEEGVVQQNMLKNTTGTAASLDADDAKSYYAEYLARSFGDEVPQPEATAKPEAPAPVPVKTEKLQEEDEQVKPSPADEVFVTVAGRHVKLSEVTEDMQEEMTPEEFKHYFALAKANVVDDDDDDDEYE